MSILDGAKNAVQGAAMAAMQTAVRLAPDAWVPGGKPDPLILRKHGQIGRPVSRVDGPLKVQGQARFAAEVPLERILYGALVYSTIAKGRIAELDIHAAEAAPGVALVMTYRNAPRLAPMPVIMTGLQAFGTDSVPVMQDDRIRWNGQPIALILAETQEEADHAASLIRVGYVAEPAVTSMTDGVLRGTETGFLFGETLKLETGDAEAALSRSAHAVDAVYRTPRHNHNAIEPHAATLAWDGDRLRIHDTNQGVAHSAWTLAQVFGIDQDRIHVSSPYVGGGFGGKGLCHHQILGAAASRLAGRPVRIALSREGVYRTVGGRSLTRQRVAIGADAEGRFTAIVHTGTTAMTRHNALPEPFILPTRTLYAAGSFQLAVEAAHLDMVANLAMRAPGEAAGSFALECAIDELAVAMGMDPIELRLRNEPETDPTMGTPFSSRHLAQAYRAGAERFGWDRRAAPGSRREGEWLVGMGCATATYPYQRMPGGAARITVTREGRARVEVGAHEMGMGTATVHGQVAADRLGLALEQVTFAYGDSELPGMVMGGGSQQTASIGASVLAAHRELVAALLKLAGNDSPLAGLAPDEIEGRYGGLGAIAEAGRHETYESILSRARRDEVVAEGSAPPPLEAQHWSMHSYGAQFCEARVNAITGETRVARFLGSFDCGRILNAKTAASQFRGGIVMGLGMALMEETLFDERSGRIMNPSLAEYHIPVHADVPEIDVIWTDIPDPRAPMGARGIGEIGITGVGAAVANAVFNATGRRVRDLPITLDKLFL